VVVVPPLVVVVVTALREAIGLLLFLIRPSLHHVMEPRGLGSVAAKISKESLVFVAVVEAVDDIFRGDVGDGGACVKEAVSVGS
jgi:hypothetical protein